MDGGFDVIVVGKRHQRLQAEHAFNLRQFQRQRLPFGQWRRPVGVFVARRMSMLSGIASLLKRHNLAYHRHGSRNSRQKIQALFGMHGVAMQRNTGLETPRIRGGAPGEMQLNIRHKGLLR
jgi:hypothetical protein